MKENSESLMQYLDENEPEGFTSEPFYVEENDTFTLFFTNDLAYAKRLDEFVTVYLSFETGEPVGVVLKGLRRCIENAKSLDVAGQFGNLSYAIKHVGVVNSTRNPESKAIFQSLNRSVESMEIPDFDELLKVS